MAGLAQRGFLLSALVRTVAVIVLRLLGQHRPQMVLAEDQHVIQALAAKGAHEPLGERVRLRRPHRRPDHPRPVTREDIIECRRELAVPVTDEEPEPPGPLAEVHQKVTGLLGSPGTSRMGGHAQDVHGTGLDLHHEQDVKTLEHHGIDIQEITGKDAGRLGFEELAPCRRRLPRCGAKPGGQDPADRPFPHPVPQAEQLAR